MYVSIYRENCRLVFNIFGLKIKIKSKILGYSSIYGKNNKIYIKKSEIFEELDSLKKINGLDIQIDGNDNIVIIEYPNDYILGCTLIIKGNNNKFELAKSNYSINSSTFSMSNYGNNRLMSIGEDFSLDGHSLLWLEEHNSKLIIGKDCMFSHNLFIRNSDGHAILDAKNNLINKAKDMIIGNHVWVCAYAKLLKNTKIADNCIVGCNSILNSNYNIPNAVIAGSPAKIRKYNINWLRDSINNYLYEKEGVHG